MIFYLWFIFLHGNDFVAIKIQFSRTNVCDGGWEIGRQLTLWDKRSCAEAGVEKKIRNAIDRVRRGRGERTGCASPTRQASCRAAIVFAVLASSLRRWLRELACDERVPACQKELRQRVVSFKES